MLKPRTKVPDLLNNNRKNIHPSFALFWGGKSFGINEDLPGHPLREVMSFITLWLNDSDTIQVKTSGSTGAPKSLNLSKKAMEASAQKTLDFFDLKPSQKTLLCMDLEHIGAKMMVVRALMGGLELHVTHPKVNLEEDLQMDFDFVPMTPAQVMGSKKALEKIETVLVGGAPLSNADAKTLLSLSTEFFVSFGMTETISHVAIKKLEEDIFTAIPGVVFSANTHQELQITAEHLDIKSLSTHDVVELIDPSHFIWKGRSDSIINSGGKKIQPEEIEGIIRPHFTGDFAISDAQHDQWGRQVLLVVTKGATPSSLRDLRFPPYSTPKGVVELSEIPKTSNGKIQRDQLRQALVGLPIMPF